MVRDQLESGSMAGRRPSMAVESSPALPPKASVLWVSTEGSEPRGVLYL